MHIVWHAIKSSSISRLCDRADHIERVAWASTNCRRTAGHFDDGWCARWAAV